MPTKFSAVLADTSRLRLQNKLSCDLTIGYFQIEHMLLVVLTFYWLCLEAAWMLNDIIHSTVLLRSCETRNTSMKPIHVFNVGRNYEQFIVPFYWQKCNTCFSRLISFQMIRTTWHHTQKLIIMSTEPIISHSPALLKHILHQMFTGSYQQVWS